MTTLWTLITRSRLFRAIGGAILALLGIWGYGKSKERVGKLKERAATKAKQQEAYIETSEKVSGVSKSASVSDARKRLQSNKR